MSDCVASAKAPVVGGKTLPPELLKSLNRVTELSSLPEITTRIVQVVEDPRSTARQIHEVVQSDPALATKILKIVNSAFYGLPSQIASLDRAIVMLGLSAVKNLALAASLSRLLKAGEVCTGFSTRDLWRHSVAVAVAAKLLARVGRYALGDEAFVAGLVHDMGLIVVQQLFTEKTRDVAERCLATPQSYCAAEETIIGADHQLFGAVLATKWKFPPALRFAIGYHHEPSSLQPEFQRIAGLIYLADTLTCRGQHGYWLTGHTQDYPEWLLQLAGLTLPDIEQVGNELGAQLVEAEQIFGSD
ncbi:MAG TPA: HDOD domain-containing protein [Phycisphaerae bacterium]|nr:HDOD domain-containing protein [Phycisphaerae bacterium]